MDFFFLYIVLCCLRIPHILCLATSSSSSLFSFSWEFINWHAYGRAWGGWGGYRPVLFLENFWSLRVLTGSFRVISYFTLLLLPLSVLCFRMKRTP